VTPGATLAGRFLVDRLLGQGGFSGVWAATDLRTGQPCAVKVLLRRAAPQHEKRLLREARVLLSLDHPCIVQIVDIADDATHGPVLAMELLRGETLRQRLLRDERLSLDDAARVARGVAAALVCAHDLGAVHRDLKPENIFLVADHDAPPALAYAATADDVLAPLSLAASRPAPAPAAPFDAVKVLDFGIVKLVALEGQGLTQTSTLTRKNTSLGTVGYMAPEQFWGNDDIDGRADLWALGAVVYECLTGGLPVVAATPNQFVYRLRQQGITPVEHLAPGLPPALATFVGRLLAFDRDDRPPDARAALDAFSAW